MTESYVDWSKIPSEYDWVATDASGEVYAYEARPFRLANQWEGDVVAPALCYVLPDHVTKLLPPWHISLIERPKAESAEPIKADENKRHYNPAFFDAYNETPFGSWPRPAQVALFEAWLDGARIEMRNSCLQNWSLTGGMRWLASSYYRLAPIPIPKAKPSIDWSQVASGFKYLARDQDGRVWLYAARPVRMEHKWLSYAVLPAARAEAFASYRPGDCDWKDSLIERSADC